MGSKWHTCNEQKPNALPQPTHRNLKNAKYVIFLKNTKNVKYFKYVKNTKNAKFVKFVKNTKNTKNTKFLKFAKSAELTKYAKFSKFASNQKAAPAVHAVIILATIVPRGTAVNKQRRRAKVRKVMHEFKTGTLHSGSQRGPKVTNRKQAIAIALDSARREGEGA